MNQAMIRRAGVPAVSIPIPNSIPGRVRNHTTPTSISGSIAGMPSTAGRGAASSSISNPTDSYPELAEEVPAGPHLDLSPSALAVARDNARTHGISLARSLEDESGLRPAEFIYALGTSLKYPVARIEELRRWHPAFDLLSLADAIRFHAVLFRDERGLLRLVIDDPFDAARLAWGDALLRRPFTWVLAHRDDMAAFIAHETAHPRSASPPESTPPDAPAKARFQTAPAERPAPAPGPVISTETATPVRMPIATDVTDKGVMRLIGASIDEAASIGATDIHLECTAEGLLIRFRVDGILEKVRRHSGIELASSVIRRVKAFARIDTGSASARVRDGRFNATVRGRGVHCRISVLPSTLGDGVVLHLAPRPTGQGLPLVTSLAGLGFEPRPIALIQRLATRPSGLFVVIGPAGSGKTSTLYGIVEAIGGAKEKIISIEDPVAGPLPGVMQVPANADAGFPLAQGLEAILRHDPDRVLVDEIADAATARIAIDAAFSGARLLAALRANDMLDLFSRLDQWGLARTAYLRALSAIVNQRLVRLNCPRCAVERRPNEALIAASGLIPGSVGSYRFRGGVGCDHCRGSGFRGRKVIADIIAINDDFRDQLQDQGPHRARAISTRNNGGRALRRQALDLVAAGSTTLEEINRVTAPDDPVA